MAKEAKLGKFAVATLKRTAQNCYPLTKKRNSLMEEIAAKQAELESVNLQIEGYQTPIREMTKEFKEGGYTTDELIVRTVEPYMNADGTAKTDAKTGKPLMQTKYSLKYPETIVPVEEPEVAGEGEGVESPVEAPADADENPDNVTID